MKADGSARKAGDYLAMYQIGDADLERIRAYGETINSQEVADNFYVWLSGMPEFPRFFPTQRLLDQVVDEQRAYWHRFWRANVDDGYLQHRRHVGATHARIRLPLNIYSAAMNAVRDISMVTLYKGHLEPMAYATTMTSVMRLMSLDVAMVTEAYEVNMRTIHGDLDSLIQIVRMVDALIHDTTESNLHSRVQEALERHEAQARKAASMQEDVT